MKLNIVIPTRNRYSTLVPTVRAILNQLKSNNFRILIYDNTPINLADAASQIPSDPRIMYYHDAQDLDAVENFNRALARVESDFVILIGDDDFVLPNIFDVIQKMELLGLECVIQKRPTYYWPSVKFNREIDYFSESSLIISNEIDDSIVELNPVAELDFVTDHGAIYLYKMPALYHGLLRTEVLKRIYKKYGSYVLGPSPDISLALLISQSIKTYAIYGTPFSIAGASFNSAAGMGRRGEHSATLDRAPTWLPKSMLESWDPRLPKIWNGFTVYAQSLYLVSKSTDIVTKINYEALYKKMLSHNFLDIKFMNGKYATAHHPKITTIAIGLLTYILRSMALSFPSFILSRLIRRHPAFRTQSFYRNINDPEACITIAMKHIKTNEVKCKLDPIRYNKV